MHNKVLARLIRWAAVAAWMGVIYFLSNQPQLPSVGGVWTELQDIAGHFVAYGVLAALLRWALAGAGAQAPGRWAFLLAVLYGVSDEFHQSFVPGRNPDPFDIATDAAGALFALAIVRVWLNRTTSQSTRALENES
jgi:VanZ family protein